MKRPPTIEAAGGILAWLDITKHRHNGYGGDDFQTAVATGVTDRRIAKDFGVEEHTPARWRKHLDSDILEK